MTPDRDIERLLDRWLDNGPSAARDRVIDVVADRIARQPQRPAWRLQLRNPTVNVNLRVAAALAVFAVLAAGAVYLRGPSVPGPGGPSAAPSPSPTASPTPAPSPRSLTSATFKPTLGVDVPADWTVSDGDRTYLLNGPAVPLGTAASIGVMTGPFVRFEDQDCQGQAPAGVGASIAEVVAALSGDPRLVVAAAQAVTIGDRSGQMVDIQVAPTWTGTCGWSQGKPAVLILSATDTGPAFGMGGTERSRYTFLDVGDSVVSINFSSPDTVTFEAMAAQTTPIIESMRFTP
jgi:hypothetical protein